MAELKTKPTEATVAGFLDSVEPATRREDGKALAALFARVTGQPARMWGPTIVGYGRYRYRYDSGHQGEMCRAGFSPRKARHSLYISCLCDGAEDPAFTALLGRLGKHGRGNGGCLYINKLADVDLGVLERMVEMSWRNSFERYPD